MCVHVWSAKANTIKYVQAQSFEEYNKRISLNLTMREINYNCFFLDDDYSLGKRKRM